MRTLSRRAIPFALAAALGFGAAALAACGEDESDGDLLRPATASELRGTLDQVEQLVDAGDCTGAGAQSAALAERVSGLPASVDSDLRDALEEGAARLQALVDDQCEAEVTTTAPTTETTPTETETEPQEDDQKKEKPDKEPKEPEGKGPDGEGPPGQQDEEQDDDESGGSGDVGGGDPGSFAP